MLRMLNIQVKVEFNPGINIEPNTEVGPDDTILGKITPHQKELFVTALQLQIIANNNSEVANGTDANGIKKLLEAKFYELSKKSDNIMDAFVIDVMSIHNIWNRYGKIDIGVRKGWWVVYTEAEKEENVSHIIKMSLN